MSIIRIKDVSTHIGEEVVIRGWLASKRSSGSIHFLMLRDGSGFIQSVVVKGEVSDEIFEACDALTQEASIIVTGIVKEDKRSKIGYEISVNNVELIGKSIDYPITPKDHGVDFLMEHRHLWIRSQRQNAVLLIRHEIMSAAMDYLNSNGFIRMDSPILTPAACEGTTTLFETDYFEEKAYLSQSGQLYNEANAMAFGKVYCFGPTFRAEKSKTRRHLMEFWMLEPEMAYTNQEENMVVQEEMVSYIVDRVIKNRRRELDVLERDVAVLEKIKPPFPRMSYDDAISFLKNNGRDIEWGDDFGAPDEALISEKFDKPVFITGFPTAMKAFYMLPDPNRPEIVLAADMLAPEGYGEIIGGSQRMHDYDMLEAKMKHENLSKEAYGWYLDLRKYGSVPHSGFGIGIERTVAWITGSEHIREMIPFPRVLNRIYP